MKDFSLVPFCNLKIRCGRFGSVTGLQHLPIRLKQFTQLRDDFRHSQLVWHVELMLHVQQRSVVSEIFFVGGRRGECLRLVPVETFVTEPLIPKERTPVMGRDVVLFSV